MLIYPIVEDKPIDLSFEKNVAEMRKKKAIEESKKMDEIKQKTKASKRYQEMLEKQKQSQKEKNKDQIMTNLNSYFMSGKLVETQEIPQLTNLAPTCKPFIPQNYNADDDPKKRKKGLFALNKGGKSKKQKITLIQQLIEETGNASQHSQKLPQIIPMKSVYEHFAPKAGVTFAEAGRSPLTGNATISQEVGRLSKNEFRTIVMDTENGQNQDENNIQAHTQYGKFMKNMDKSISVVKLKYGKDIPESQFETSNQDNKVAVTGDIGQLLFDQSNYRQYINTRENYKSVTSLIPAFYVPPKTRLGKSAYQSQRESADYTLTKSLSKNMHDQFNLGLEGADLDIRNMGNKPIVKGMNMTLKHFFEKLSIF